MTCTIEEIKCCILFGFIFFDAIYYLQVIYFPVGQLPKNMVGPRMTPTPKGDNVLLTYETSVYTLENKGSKYEWTKLPHDLSISRGYHVQALVPAATINC